MHRIFLTTSDLQILTGTSSRNCREKLKILKDTLSKQKHQHITISEYCNYEGISYKEVLKALNLIKEENSL